VILLGVDIGNQGAVALIDEAGELIEVCDMPCLDDGPKGRPSVNAPLLAAIVARAGASRTFVEFVGPRPGEGAVRGFAFGRCKGVLEGVLAAHGVPVTFLMPAAWKTAIRTPPGKVWAKDAARSAARRGRPVPRSLADSQRGRKRRLLTRRIVNSATFDGTLTEVQAVTGRDANSSFL
jgi:crossover junction endodeoxyribonuclease RuvC